MTETLIPKHGGYRSLKSFQVAQLAYDVTVLFCEKFVPGRSRTHNQMVQAARSGVQNIAEGSQASGTSKKMELKLTSVARASLEELRLDYEDFLRQRGLPQLEPEHPALVRFKARRCAKLDDVRQWVAEEMKRRDEHGLSRTGTDKMQSAGAVPGSVPVHNVHPRHPAPRAHAGLRARPCQSVPVHNVHSPHKTPRPRNPGRQRRPFPPEPGLPPPGPPAGRPGRKLSSGGRFHRTALPPALQAPPVNLTQADLPRLFKNDEMRGTKKIQARSVS